MPLKLRHLGAIVDAASMGTTQQGFRANGRQNVQHIPPISMTKDGSSNQSIMFVLDQRTSNYDCILIF